ncbi:hypothetical protein SAMN05421812_109232 [Asanoa hainanensis]|uniref:Uncharacterized protein n=1 Tax=Asanoa hainanensis TaxID=560556 RepID=A0A239NKW1_9ACTN|nr:hypothetical protein SAMN05421812_109232 [Asanoa hainanensis]
MAYQFVWLLGHQREHVWIVTAQCFDQLGHVVAVPAAESGADDRSHGIVVTRLLCTNWHGAQRNHEPSGCQPNNPRSPAKTATNDEATSDETDGDRSWDGRRGQPLIAPLVMPATIRRLKNMNMINGGIVIRRMFMKRRLYCDVNWLEKL